MTLIRFLFLSLILLLSIITYGQDADVLFESLEADLPSNSVRTIMRDHYSYVWFGTSGGLVKYDGMNYQVYEKSNEEDIGLSHNGINAILEDPSHQLWIGTSVGLNLYDREQDRFLNPSIKHQKTFENIYVKTLINDDQNRLWIGTFGNGLLLYEPQTDSLIQYSNNYHKPTMIDGQYITCMLLHKDRLWLGTREGLFSLSLSNGKFKHHYLPLNKGSKTTYVSALALDENSKLWVGTWDGLFSTDLDSQTSFDLYSQDAAGDSMITQSVVLSLWADYRGKLWVGTENIGLHCVDLNKNLVTNYQHERGNHQSIEGNSIWSLYVDHEDILWIGVYSHGINRVNIKSQKFTLIQHNPFQENSLPDNDIRGLSMNREGKIWIATDNGGIGKFNPATREVEKILNKQKGNPKLNDDGIMAVLYDSKDNLWIGTWTQGVDRLSPDEKQVQNYPIIGRNEAGNNKVISLYEDSKGNIWVGTSGSGLFYWDKDTQSFLHFIFQNTTAPGPDSYVTCFGEDSKDRLWIGTLYGLYCLSTLEDGSYSGRLFHSAASPDSLSSNSIHVIQRDSRGQLWFGTGDNGINILTLDDRFESLGEEEGLPGNAVRSIVEDQSGHIWIATNKGLSRFDPGRNTFENYTKEDGLSENFYVRSGLRTINGELFFGGKDGLNSFFPDNIKKNDFVPNIYLTDLKINGESVAIGQSDSPLCKHISLTKEITLSHEQNALSIDFVAVNFTHPMRNQYSYKLEGFDKGWNFIGNKHSATYTNLDPGNYVFYANGSNNDGVWNEEPATLAITIEPAIWKTWWAKTGYILLALVLVFLYFKAYTEWLQANSQLKIERMARENDMELSRMKMQFFTNISHEIRTPLSLIIAPIESMLSRADNEFKEQLSTAHRNSQRMMRMINELMDFQKLEELKMSLKVSHTEAAGFIMSIAESFKDAADNRNIQFEIELEDHLYGYMDKSKVETVILNLLANAFKYVEDNGHILLRSRCISTDNPVPSDEDQERFKFLEIVVADNGIGIQAEEVELIFEKFYQVNSFQNNQKTGTGLGLSMCKKLVELHHGTIEVISEPHEETRFTVTIPIEKNVYREEEILETWNPHLSDEHSENASSATMAQSAEHLESSQILIVEDSQELRNYLVGEIGKHFKVLSAADGQSGVELAKIKIPDLIVSDIIMPNKSGFELCQELKNDIKTSHIPIILLTARDTLKDKIKGIDTGADAYFPKPFSIQLLTTQIEKLIESRRKLFVNFSQEAHLIPSQLAEGEIDRAFLEKVTDYIIDNIKNPQLNVDLLSQQFNMSRSQTYRKIKALTGRSTVEYIKVVRLKQALKLMNTREYSLAEISFKMGFASPSYFTKTFKEFYGKTPSEYTKT